MDYETALQIGVDLIAPAVVMFTVWYGFRPWYTTHIGRAVMAHAAGSTLLFGIAFFDPWMPEDYPGREPITLFIVFIWIIGWWYMVFALWKTRANGDAT